LVQELIITRGTEILMRLLAGRFGSVPQEIAVALQTVEDIAELEELAYWGGSCPDLEAFRTRLMS
jgi:hypothetical protein